MTAEFPRITRAPIDVGFLMSLGESDSCGAAVVFLGTVRDMNEGRTVRGLRFDCYDILAERLLRELESEVVGTNGIESCWIQHRVGPLNLRDVCVAIVVRSGHRPEAFAAARQAIEELKKRIPIWKQEQYLQGDCAYLDGVTLAMS